jgi:hypothetical protein
MSVTSPAKNPAPGFGAQADKTIVATKIMAITAYSFFIILLLIRLYYAELIDRDRRREEGLTYIRHPPPHE